jgi:hypothetical protein
MIQRKYIIGMLVLGLLLEGGVCWYASLESGSELETLRLTARFSGRLSFFAYLGSCFLYFLQSQSNRKSGQLTLWFSVAFFAWVHLVHLGFLAANVIGNEVSLVPAKVLGGALAYGMILVYPFVMRRLPRASWWHPFHFYYVGFVMLMTFIARVKGDFEGATPEGFHSVAIGLLCVTFVASMALCFKRIKSSSRQPNA